MSERQAKKIRKENPAASANTKKKAKSDILTNSVIAVVVAAMVGLGGWAIYSDYASKTASTDNVQTEIPSAEDMQTQMPTIAEAAEQAGKTTEEYLAEYGLDSREDITGDTDLATAMEFVTLANYAKMSGIELAELRTAMGIPEDITDDTLMSDVYTALQEAAAEQSAETETTEGEAVEETTQDAAETSEE